MNGRKGIQGLLIGVVLLVMISMASVAGVPQEASSLAIQPPPEPAGMWKTVFASTDGPLTPQIVEVNFTITKGNAYTTSVITRLMTNPMIKYIYPSRCMLMVNMDFTISYKVLNPELVELPQCFYESRIHFNDSEQTVWLWEEEHQLSVTNFTGGFLFIRCQPFKLIPARFAFVGQCDEASIVRL